MLRNQSIVFCMLTIFGNSINLYGMENNYRVARSMVKVLSFSERKEFAQRILSTPLDNLNDMELYAIGEKFKEDND